MATKLYDLIVATSKYQDQNGQEKRKWENVGAMWQDTDNNGNSYCYIMLKRIFNPAGLDVKEGADSIRITLSKPKQQQEQGQSQQNSQYSQQAQTFANNPNFNQDINFGQPVEGIPF